jgi:hypothetical protein
VTFQRAGSSIGINPILVNGLYEGPEAEELFENKPFPCKLRTELGFLDLTLRREERNQAVVERCPILGESGDGGWWLFSVRDYCVWFLVDYNGNACGRT